MFIAALFIIARIWKQPKCPSTEEWLKKMLYIYSAVKYNDILKFVCKWTKLEKKILSEVTPTQKGEHGM